MSKQKRKVFGQKVFDRLWADQKGLCNECGCEMSVTVNSRREVASSPVFPNIDHIVPLSKGGADSVENLQLLCRKCNRGKG